MAPKVYLSKQIRLWSHPQPFHVYGFRKQEYTTTPSGCPKENRAGACPLLPPTLLSFTALSRNRASGSFHCLLTPCQQGCSLWKQRELQSETRTWGQTSCFISQRFLGRHMLAAHSVPPPQDWGWSICTWPQCRKWEFGWSAPIAYCSYPAVPVISYIVNSTYQRSGGFFVYHFEHSPSQILRLRWNCTLNLPLYEGGRKSSRLTQFLSFWLG